MTITEVNFSKIQKYILFFYISVCPIFWHNGLNFGPQTLRISQAQFFQIGIVLMFSTMIKNIWLSLFLMLTVGLYAFFSFQSNVYVMNVFMACMLYHLVDTFLERKDIPTVLSIIKWLVFANILWMVFQLCGWDFLFKMKSDGKYAWDPVGLMGIKAVSGLFIALCVPIMARANSFVALLMFYPMWLTQCSVAIVGGGLGYLFHLYQFKRKFFYIALVVGLLFGSYYVYNDSKANMFGDRLSLWKITLRDAVKHPVAGWGLDSFRNMSKYKTFMYVKNVETNKTGKAHKVGERMIAEPGLAKPEDRIDPWDNVHNEYIQLFYEFGFIAFIILGLLIGDMVRRFNRYDRDVVAIMGFFIVLAVVSIGQFPFHLARVGFLIPVLYACYNKLTDHNVTRPQ